MSPEQAVAFLGFAVVMAGTPGPSNALLTAAGANVGVRRGIPALLGVLAGMAALMFVVAFGLGAVLLETPLLLTAVKLAGAVFLLWLAWKIATASPDHDETTGRSVGFAGAATFQWVNPKSWLACTSAAAGFLDPGAGNAAVQAGSLALLFVLAALPCCFVWLAFGALVHRTLRSERASRAFNLGMGVLLLASVVLFFV